MFEFLIKRKQRKGWRPCPHCGIGNLCWDSEECAEDIGYSVAGMITNYNCHNCGAEIEVFVPSEKEV